MEKRGARASLAFDPGESTHIDFSATWWRNESDTVAGQGIGFTPATASSPFNAPGLVNYLASNQPREASDGDWAPSPFVRPISARGSAFRVRCAKTIRSRA